MNQPFLLPPGFSKVQKATKEVQEVADEVQNYIMIFKKNQNYFNKNIKFTKAVFMYVIRKVIFLKFLVK